MVIQTKIVYCLDFFFYFILFFAIIFRDVTRIHTNCVDFMVYFIVQAPNIPGNDRRWNNLQDVRNNWECRASSIPSGLQVRGLILDIVGKHLQCVLAVDITVVLLLPAKGSHCQIWDASIDKRHISINESLQGVFSNGHGTNCLTPWCPVQR